MKKCILWLGLLTTGLSLYGCGGESFSGGSGTPSNPGGNQNNNSQAGSTATMLPFGDTLYILDHSKLKTVDLGLSPPAIVKESRLIAPETLFIYEEHLYIGGETGVTIFDLTDPLNPLQVSSYQHIRSCDPIIVEDGIGYITLRSGSGTSSRRCGGLRGANRLELVDMTNPRAPQYISEFAMSNPFGLAKTDALLAICQENFGLSMLNVDDANNIAVESTYPQINCFDLINTDKSLIATATDGIYQFEVSGKFLAELSIIPVGMPDAMPMDTILMSDLK